MSGIFPLATSVTTLVVMFAILLKLDVTVALLSLTVVPFLYLCLRYYTSTLVEPRGARQGARVEADRAAVRNVLARCAWSRASRASRTRPTRYAAAGDRTMDARIALTWQQSLFAVVVSTITILGTALVLIVGGMHVMRGQMTIGDLTVVIAYLGAVYGPLSAIAHTTGQLQGALAGARRVRAMLALMPETVDAPDAIDATGVRGDIRFEDVGFSYPDGTEVLHDITFEAKPGQMVALVGLTGAGKTTLVSLIPRFYDATTGRVLDRRRRRAPATGPIAARADRDRAAGSGALLRHDRRQPALRPARRDATRRSKRRRGRRTRTTSSRACRRATTRRSPKPAAACRAASASG